MLNKQINILKQLYMDGKDCESAEEILAGSICELADENEFFSLNLNIISNIINKAGILPIEIAKKIIYKSYQIYGFKSISLIENMECGNIGLKSIDILKPYLGSPLIRELVANCTYTDSINDNDNLLATISSLSNELAKLKHEVDVLRSPDKKNIFENDDIIGASRKGDLEIVKELLKAHPSLINKKDQNDWTPLFWACYNGHLEVARFLIDNFASLSARDKDDAHPIIYAAQDGKNEIVRLLIERGVSLETKDIRKNTPLKLAAYYGQHETVRILLNAGANIEACNSDGTTALISASMQGRIEMCHLLIEKGANVEAKDYRNQTPLFVAAQNGRMEIVELLLENNARVDAVDRDQWTPLIAAANSGRAEMCRLLIQRGAAIEARDKSGRTALVVASSIGHTETVWTLLEAGAEIEASDNSKNTPLIAAAFYGFADIVVMLLKKGADTNAVHQIGKTAIEMTRDEKIKTILANADLYRQ